MSATDPYAAPDAPNVEEARLPVPEPVEAPVEAVEASQIEFPVVPEGSIKTVLAWVGEDRTKAQAALAYEIDNEGRKTLIKELNNLLND